MSGLNCFETLQKLYPQKMFSDKTCIKSLKCIKQHDHCHLNVQNLVTRNEVVPSKLD